MAGKELLDDLQAGSWIRPVSARPGGAVSAFELQYQDGAAASVLDVMNMLLLEQRPDGHQRENWVFESQIKWTKLWRVSLPDLSLLTDPTAPLWTNARHTSAGLRDEVSLVEAAELTDSLRFINVPHLTLSVRWHWGKVKVQGRFTYAGESYWLWVTDPHYEDVYRKMAIGEYPLGESWLTVSLTGPFEERQACYKVIAAIIRSEQAT